MAAKSQGTAKAARGPGRQFKPGQSGNPNGRPKKTDELRRIEELAREHSQTAMATLVEIMRDKGARESARVSAACAVLDRGWGRAPQVVELANKDDKPLELVNVPPEVATQIYLERVRGQIPK